MAVEIETYIENMRKKKIKKKEDRCQHTQTPKQLWFHFYFISNGFRISHYSFYLSFDFLSITCKCIQRQIDRIKEILYYTARITYILYVHYII